MMLMSGYDYTVLYCTVDGRALAQSPIEVDWEPALEWARFTALRENSVPRPDATEQPGVDPAWHPEVGEPYVAGFSVRVPDLARPVTFTNTYFAKYAHAGSMVLVEQGRLQAGDKFLYLVFASPRERQASEPGRVRFRAAQATRVRPSAALLAEFLAAAEPAGVHNANDLPVFFPGRVLDEVTQIYRERHDTETGGVLVGCLHRNLDGQLFLEVTAQVPALHTDASATHLTFTAETWKAVRAAITLRNREELWVGWWHTHPIRSWTSEHGAASHGESGPAVSGGFFSPQDAALHRAAFVTAHSVALVVSDLGPELETYSLFGWREGAVVSRGFHILRREVGASPPGPGSKGGRTIVQREQGALPARPWAVRSHLAPVQGHRSHHGHS
jgi:hypothetical protein